MEAVSDNLARLGGNEDLTALVISVDRMGAGFRVALSVGVMGMSGTVYRKSEIVGASTVSVSEAIETAVARATKTLRNVDWFEVGEIRGQVKDGKVSEYQVTLKVGFRLDE